MDTNRNKTPNTGEKMSLEECREELTAFHHRTLRLQMAVEISRILSSILDPEELLPQLVELIRQRFDLYYVGLFLVDQSGERTGEPNRWALLRAATGLAGKRMLAEGYKLEVNTTSSVGACIVRRQSQIIDRDRDMEESGDTGAAPFDNPLLPETRSELVVPLLVRGQAIGAITLQSDRASAFDDEQSAIMQTLADQLSNAIANAHLYEQLRSELNDRKRAERALRESEERLSTLLNAMPNGIIVVDPQTHTIVDANAAALDMIQASSPEKIIGAVCHTRICPAEEGQCPITDLHQSVDHAEHVLLTALGQEIPILKTVTTVTLNGREHLLETFVDISERKQFEKALQESEEKYRTILESITDGYYEIDIDGNILFFNHALSDILGYPPDELTGLNYRQCMSAESAQEAYQALSEVYRSGQPMQGVEWEIIRPDGSTRLIETSISLRYDDAGHPIGFRGLAHDITERHQAEMERAQLLADLERRNTQLQTAAEVSRAVSSILDPEALIPQVVDLVRERFELYYVGLFLVDQTGEWTDEPGRWAVLRAGTGEAGRGMLQEGHKLEIGGHSMIGWCIANQQARVALDTGEDAARFENPLLPKTRSELALPLISRGRAIGALTIQSEREAAFTPEDIAVLQTMADQLANAITNARLYNQAQREIHERKQAEETLRQVNQNLAVFSRLTQKFTAFLDMQQTSHYLLSEAVELFDAAGALLWIVENETGELVCQAALPPDLPPQTLSLHLPIEQESIVGWVVQIGDSAFVPTAQEDLRFAGEAELPASLHAASLLVVPLRAREQVIGVLEVIAQPDREFETDDLILAETIAASAGIAIANARLYTKAQQEIAERRQAEEALRRSEEQYRHLIENANEGIAVAQGDRFQLVNSYLANITGYTEEEMLTLPFITFVHPDDREMVTQRYVARLKGLEAPAQYEFRLARRDGQIRWAEIKSVRIEWKGTPAILLFLSDITDRKVAEAALERAHKELAIYTDHLERRTTQLQVGAEVAREAATIRDVHQLLNTAVHLISERFGFYHAGIFLIDEAGKYALLRAASSEGGQRMLARRHKLEVGKTGIVGHVAATGEPRIALDVGKDAVHFANPDLPDTRSEMGLPLKIHGKVIGVLDVQDVREAAFSEDDIAVLQTLADQLAIAIDNARLLQRNEAQIRELEMLYGEYSARVWSALTTTDRPRAYLYDRIEVTPTDTIPVPGIDQAMTHGETVALVAPETEERTLITPLKLHDRIIGTLGVLEQDGGRPWTPGEMALLEAVGEQVALALEDAQHFAETQRSAQQMRLLNELGQSLTTRLNTQEIVEETYRGTSRLLDTTNFYIALYDAENGNVSFPLSIEHGQPVQWKPRPMGNGLTEYVIRSREPLLIREKVEEELTKRGIDSIGAVALSWMGTPIIVANQVLGVIAIQDYTTPNAYDQRDLDLLSAIATQTAIALQNARLFEQVQRQAQRERQIYEITSRIRRSPDIEHILKTTVSELAQALHADRAIVRLTTKEELQGQKDGDGHSPAPGYTTATESESKRGTGAGQ